MEAAAHVVVHAAPIHVIQGVGHQVQRARIFCASVIPQKVKIGRSGVEVTAEATVFRFEPLTQPLGIPPEHADVWHARGGQGTCVSLQALRDLLRFCQ